MAVAVTYAIFRNVITDTGHLEILATIISLLSVNYVMISLGVKINNAYDELVHKTRLFHAEKEMRTRKFNRRIMLIIATLIIASTVYGIFKRNMIINDIVSVLALCVEVCDHSFVALVRFRT